MFTHYLRKLLPNVDLTTNHENHQILLDSSIQQEQKLIMVLLNYFDSQKIKYVDGHTLETEAKYINKLFPKLARSYILGQLDMFKDMPQRVEIVLRTIVYSKVCKVSSNNTTTPDIKRTISNDQIQRPSFNLGEYCHPIKIRKVSDGCNSTYAIANNVKATNASASNYLVPPLFFGNHYTTVKSSTDKTALPNLCYIPPMKSCTVTSVTAVTRTPHDLQLVDDNNSTLAAPEPGPFSISQESPYVVQNTPQYCDSSSHVKETPSMNSSVVSSSDEVLNFPQLKEENVSTSNEQCNDERSAIYEPDYLVEPPICEQELEIETDTSSLPVAQNCTVNSSNETIDMINKSVYLDFFSELQVEEGPSNSHTDETLPSIQDTKESDDNIPLPTSDELVEMDQEEFDSEKTVVFSPTIINEFIKKDIVTEIEMVGQVASVDDENATAGDGQQYISDIPSTSKQSDVAEQFDLIHYLREITNTSVETILKQCRRMGVRNFLEKPPLNVMEIIVDNLLSNSISSENSDMDEDDLDAVKVVSEENFLSTSAALPKRFKSVIEISNTAESGVTIVPIVNGTGAIPKRKRVLQHDDVVPSLEEGVKDKSSEDNIAVDQHLVNYLCSIFPDASPVYIKGLCKDKPMNNEVVDELTTLILNSNGTYPKRPVVQPEPEVFPENQLEILIEFLPDADPDYLRMMCDRFEGKPDLVKAFLNEAMERKNYPTKKEYQRRQQLSAQQKQYTTDFNIKNFIKLIPDPHKFFSDPARIVTMDPLSAHYALVFLRNTFNKLPVRLIQSSFTRNSNNLSKTYTQLQLAMSQTSALMKSTRKPIELPKGMQNIPLLQEIAYFTHLEEINDYLHHINEKEQAERDNALRNGLMQTCNCCYDEEVLPRDVFKCENGCSFCKCCIVKSSEVRFGEGKLDFPCLMNCESQFSLQTLQAVLSPKLFSKIAQKKALEEVKAAGIEELEMCPFCDFATIPAPGYSIFSCLNPECMKESCRLCKEPSHIPLKCNEIEKDEDVKARTFVENKMTEALLKKCWKCGIKYFKEEGCNKMTCSCGASMCYVCGKPVTDYKHFNGNGGDRFDLCPLYNDTNAVNKENVLRAGEQAKAEIGNRALKHDPTVDIEKHYKERTKLHPQHHILVQQQRQTDAFLAQMRNVLNRPHRRRRF